MIAINDYRQFFAELVAAASNKSGVEVDKTRLAVTETQLINLLKDQKGIVVAGNIPSFDVTYGSYWLSSGECIIYVLEKMPEDYQGTDREFERYADLQRLMSVMLQYVSGETMQQFCDQGELDISQGIRVEWEYNTFGGFNGLSAVFRLKDKNGTGL